MELRRQAMKDLPVAIAAADDLVDFRFANASPSQFKKFKKGKKGQYSCDSGKNNRGQKAKQRNS